MWRYIQISIYLNIVVRFHEVYLTVRIIRHNILRSQAPCVSHTKYVLGTSIEKTL